MKILISGNPAFGLAEALNTVLEEYELMFVAPKKLTCFAPSLLEWPDSWTGPIGARHGSC